MQNNNQWFQGNENNQVAELFTKTEQNDLVRDLGLPKNSAELLGSRLKEKNLLVLEPLSICMEKEKVRVVYFSKKGDLVYCSVIAAFMHKFGIECKVDELRLFIGSFKSVKVFLHNGNRCFSTCWVPCTPQRNLWEFRTGFF